MTSTGPDAPTDEFTAQWKATEQNAPLVADMLRQSLTDLRSMRYERRSTRLAIGLFCAVFAAVVLALSTGWPA
jgi:hypothetical protein